MFIRGIPMSLPDRLATTIVLDTDGEPRAQRQKGAFWIPG